MFGTCPASATRSASSACSSLFGSPAAAPASRDRQRRIVLGLDAGIGGELPRMRLAHARRVASLLSRFGELALFDSWIARCLCRQLPPRRRGRAVRLASFSCFFAFGCSAPTARLRVSRLRLAPQVENDPRDDQRQHQRAGRQPVVDSWRASPSLHARRAAPARPSAAALPRRFA